MTFSKSLALVLALGALALPASAQAAQSYCSASGDVCYGARYAGGDVFLSITLGAKYFDAYRLCVTPAGYAAGRECKRFSIRSKANGLYGSTVRWSRYFTDEGGGKYYAVFKGPDGKLGPRVTFLR